MQMDINEIMRHLAHRPPFLLVDRVLECVPGRSIKAIKNVTINEPFFQGHFPAYPVMPGVLIIEALAQASGLLVFLSAQAQKASQPMYYLVKVDNAKFSQLVVPGDQLILEVELKRMLRKMGLFACKALVNGKQVAEAELLCAEKSDA